MTEIERKALELVNEVLTERRLPLYDEEDIAANTYVIATLCRAIEQHERFRQDVSDAVEAVFAGYHDAPIPWVVMRRKLDRFIIAKPDPLVEAWDETWAEPSDKPARLETFRAALAKRGLEIREKE